MTETLFCACCYNVATHRGSDDAYRCDLHRLSGDTAPFDTSVVDALRAALREIEVAVDHVDHEQGSPMCDVYLGRGRDCTCGIAKIRTIVERAVGGAS